MNLSSLVCLPWLSILGMRRATCRAGLGLIAALALLQSAQAQDVRSRSGTSAFQSAIVYAAAAPRSSPFTPPDKDVFLVDAGSSLDTGCVFNDGGASPLTIDVPVDRFVGDVDANGYLVNPAPLVAAGIIPGAVDIVFPAYDVDYNGAAPPERDELSFNGQVLGFLTGDDNVWKLNSFRVDIRKIKFPARPKAGTNPVPVNNRIQVRIDTLSTGRWCTQIDWVAIVLPIRPKLGLDLEVAAGSNPVRSNAGVAITKIQEQNFDANCNIDSTTSIGPIEDYPFSGPMLSSSGGAGSARVKAKIKACPEGSLKPPEVTAEWVVEGTKLKGSKTWSGLDGDVEFQMPDSVGAYIASLKVKLDNGQTIDASRRLYVTRKPPLLAAAPKINWYKQGTSWAKGEKDETPIVSKIVSGIYGYGGGSWKYTYDASGGACTWEQLMDDPITCNYSDCYAFSDVLDNIGATLGVGTFKPEKVVGTPGGRGFITTGAPSLDPKFKGSAKPVGGGDYDRYVFASHSLRFWDKTYYDSTFNGRYGTSTAFIAASLDGRRGTDANGTYLNTYEGVRIYPRPGYSYMTWSNYDYLLPAAPKASPLSAAVKPSATGTSLLRFIGASAFRTPDADRNGRFETLDVDIDMEIVTAGNYVVQAELQTAGGQLVANRPRFDSMLDTTAQLGGLPGTRRITLRFSGEQIRQSLIDGPYRLVMYANSETADAGEATLATPAYRSIDFGERKAQLRSLVATPVDGDGSGKFETLRLTFDAEPAAAGPFQITASVAGAGKDLVSNARLVMLNAGTQSVTVDLPATGIARSGIDGPYTVTVNLAETTGTGIDSAGAVLSGFGAAQFEGVVDVNPSLVEQLIDSNANGLFDLLRVGTDVRARSARSAILHATLVGANGASVAADAGMTLAAGVTQRVNLDFSGPLIRSLQMASQYQLDLSFRDPVTLKEFDALRLPLRGVYVYTRFDPAEAPRAIALNGTRSDRGVDTNGNGLFERLQIDLGVDLLTAGTYDWSARLVDRNGVEIAFAANRGTLAAGAGSIRLEFDGRAIAQNGFDGPFTVRSLLMSSTNGANLVATFAGETSAWRASQFEGYVVRQLGDLNADGRVDAQDVAAFNRAFGASVGDANYNRFADFDRDGRVTINDLRMFRSYQPR